MKYLVHPLPVKDQHGEAVADKAEDPNDLCFNNMIRLNRPAYQNLDYTKMRTPSTRKQNRSVPKSSAAA